MKTLVLYYSRTGNTRELAAGIAKALGADAERIADVRDREGFLGYAKSVFDTAFGLSPELKPVRANPSDYELVIIGTPVWGNTVSTPIRTWLKRSRGRIKKAAFFCSYGQSGEEKAFADMADLAGVRPIATLAIEAKDMADAASYRSKFAPFNEACRTGMTRKKVDEP